MLEKVFRKGDNRQITFSQECGKNGKADPTVFFFSLNHEAIGRIPEEESEVWIQKHNPHT